MFIECIEIKNLFAYYGCNEIRFLERAKKNVYCICGENSFGKTSLIRCAKLLFLGSGLNDYEIPEVISRFTKKRVSKATDLIEGNKNWRGILNDKAVSEGENDYHICFYGKLNNQSFRIKRSWKKTSKNIIERVEYEKGDEIFYDDEAQEKINAILSPNFVEFFFFDGEEIENIGDSLKTTLKEKIVDIFKISSLEKIIKQSKIIQKDLKTSALENEEKRRDYVAKNNELDSEKERQNILQKKIKMDEENIDEMVKRIKEIKEKKSRILEDESQKIRELISKKNELEAQYVQNKSVLPLLLKDVVFLSNRETLRFLGEKIQQLEAQSSLADIDSLCRLLPEIKKVFLNNFKEYEAEHVLRVCDMLPMELEKKISSSQFYIPRTKIKQIKETLSKYQGNSLAKLIADFRDMRVELDEIREEIRLSNDDDIARIKMQKLDEESRSLEENQYKIEKSLEKKKIELLETKTKIEILSREISTIEIGIDDERIEKKLQLLNQIIDSIEEYKSRLINILKIELREKILDNYKKLISNDNVKFLEITEDFDILLKDSAQHEVFVSNQSSGQRQILAISIFWALKEISRSNMPLIIDTPLSRIDTRNRKNIITQYYAKASHQVIILPHSGEMSKKEYEVAHPYIADFYKIINSTDRNEAKIIECDNFYDAMKE